MHVPEAAASSPARAVPVLRYLSVAGLWFALAWLAATRAPAGSFWQALAALLVFALPLALAGLQDLAVGKTLRRERFLHSGRLFRWFSGRTLPGVLILAWALCAAVILLLRLHLLDGMDWLLLIAAVPLHWLVSAFLRRWLRDEYKPWLLEPAVQAWARLLCPTLLLLPFLLVLRWQEAMPVAVSLGEAIAEAQQQVDGVQAGASLALVAAHLAVLEGIETFVVARLGEDTSFLLDITLALDAWMRSYLLCVILGVFLWSRNEWRRLFGPLSDVESVPRLSRARLAWSAAVFSFVLGFVYLPLLGWVELRVRAEPALAGSAARLRLRVEQIGDAYYAPGTLDALQRAQQSSLARYEVLSEQVRIEADAAFDAMAGSVDAYLDWYYSLGAEYGRLAHLLIGDLEQYLARQLGERLRQDAAFARVEATLAAGLAESEEARVLHARLVSTILAQSRVEPGDQGVEVVQHVPLAALPDLPAPQELLDLQQRLLLSGGGAATAGVLGGVIAGKLTTKMLGKSGFKFAAQGLGKLVAGKAAGTSLGAGGGAAAGAALGSVIPGLGTAVGALIGGVIGGVAVGVGVDKALIELEELVSREQFRNELLQAIEEARQEFLATL